MATLWEPLSDDGARVKCFRTRSVFAVHFAFFAGDDATRRRRTPESDKGGWKRRRRRREGGKEGGRKSLHVRTKAIEKSEKPEGSE